MYIAPVQRTQHAKKSLVDPMKPSFIAVSETRRNSDKRREARNTGPCLPHFPRRRLRTSPLQVGTLKTKSAQGVRESVPNTRAHHPSQQKRSFEHLLHRNTTPHPPARSPDWQAPRIRKRAALTAARACVPKLTTQIDRNMTTHV